MCVSDEFGQNKEGRRYFFDSGLGVTNHTVLKIKI